MAIYKKSFEPKLIYVYRINDESHKGLLKIGETFIDVDDGAYFLYKPNCSKLNQAAIKRIEQETGTAAVPFDLLHTEISSYFSNKEIISFQDFEIHNILIRSGIKRKEFDLHYKANEWFETDLETVKKAILAAKEGRTSLNPNEISHNQSPIVFRPEQKTAIDKTVKLFKKKSSSHQMLWNAKMRFGKTLSALQVIKELEYKRTLIITHRPVVDEGWYEDFKKIFYDTNNYKYVSKNNGVDFANLEKLSKDSNTNYICFASMQDMRGSEIVGGKFSKNELVFEINWDFIIIDEAHEGTQTELGQKVLKECQKKDTKVLHLSGTPFNLMDDFGEDEIFTWDYIMEQKAKNEWDKIHKGDPNPYIGLPKLNIFTYDLGKLFAEYYDEDIAFNFKEFFRVNEDGKFIHENNVKQFLDLLVKKDDESNYPYSTEEYRDNFRHSLWMIPGVKEAKALSHLLQEHPVFKFFNIANVAGDGDEEIGNSDALDIVNKAIGKNPEESYSITLSCGRLTTGVSVKPWTACFMLSGSYSTGASTYMQTIFRVQTPAIIGGKQKTECFVFDFAPDRTLKVIAETAKISSKAGQTSHNDKTILGEFLNFCPIIGFDGSKMKTYDTSAMLEQLKKVYVERVVRNGFEDSYLYNNDLMKLDSLQLEEFSKLKSIIGTTKAMGSTGDININSLGLTEEEYEQLNKKKTLPEKTEPTPEELERRRRLAEAKKNRDSAISILRGISIRMPLLIYGADLNSELFQEEEEITIDNFADKIDDQSWSEFMPAGVTKTIFNNFKKYYDEDIFRSAGRRIRQMARAADSLPIEERIERITTIFNSFRNPDKETVLTPWRVVNKHLTDCIGGYSFFDKDFKNPITEPILIENDDISKNIYKKDTHILEINAKSGLYALYCAYSVFRFRAKKEIGTNPSEESKKLLWDDVLKNNIYIICKTPMAKSITKRTLVGFTSTKINAHYFEDLTNQIKNKPENFISKVSKTNYWKKDGKDMKFDAIVGNPPYQENVSSQNTNNESLAKQLFPYFIQTAILMKPNYISLLTPSRYFTGDAQDKSFVKLRNFIKDNNHYKSIFNYPNNKDLFPSAEIKGGVNYFLYDQNYMGLVDFYNCENNESSKETRKLFEDGLDIIVSDKNYYNAINKVTNSNNFISLTTITKGRNAFGIIGKQSIVDEVSSVNKKDGDAILRCKNNTIRYINPDIIDKNKDVFKNWKVFISKSAGNPQNDQKVIGKGYVGCPYSACTDSLIPIGCFETEIEAINLQKYLATKFLRFMVQTVKSSQNVTQIVYKFVPLQDFTNNSDIDWNKSLKLIDEDAKSQYGFEINELDAQLYKKYNFDINEITFIEKNIKSLE